ncbi:CDP-alcohol phosphatidyltransferase family protein [Schinkia sp. CFF1]
MVSIYQIKPWFQKLHRPFVNKLAAWGVTANQVTLAAMLLSIGTGIALYIFHEKSWIYFLIPFVLLWRMSLNAVDGMLAREHNMKSNLGLFLNELGDVVSDAALYLPFALIMDQSLVVAVIILAIISEMTGVLGQVVGASRRYDGPMGKSDRAFVFSLLAIFYGIGKLSFYWANLILVVIAILIFMNIIIRMKKALGEVRS